MLTTDQVYILRFFSKLETKCVTISCDKLHGQLINPFINKENHILYHIEKTYFSKVEMQKC